jgi:thiol-disulfide isomerase/thioredoxin
MFSGYLLEPFLNGSGGNEGELAPVSSETPASFLGHPALKLAVGHSGKPREPGDSVYEVYMDSTTRLPIGYTVNRLSINRAIEVRFEDLKVGSPIDPAAFKYEPKIAANADPINYLLPVGMKAPLFKGMAIGERAFDLASSIKGAKAVVLNFWGIGCLPCRAELPKLQDLQNRYAAKGLKVITLQPSDDGKTIAAFMKQAHLNLTTLFESSCKPSAIEDAYRGAGVIPTTYLIDGKGTIVARYITDEVTQLRKDLASLGFKD